VLCASQILGSFSTSVDLDLQQRSLEYHGIAEPFLDEMRVGLLERMPPVDVTVSHCHNLRVVVAPPMSIYSLSVHLSRALSSPSSFFMSPRTEAHHCLTTLSITRAVVAYASVAVTSPVAACAAGASQPA
jgi:hypothetical protein